MATADYGTMGRALSGGRPNPLLGGLPSPDEAADPTDNDPGTVDKKFADSPAVRDVLASHKAGTDAALDRIHKAQDQADALQPPVMEPPPKKPDVQNTPPSERWGSVAMLLAGFGGLLTQTPLAASLDAMAKVNHAYNEGDAEAAKNAYATWKVENDNAIKMNEFHNKAYEGALKKVSSDYTGAVAEARIMAVSLKDDVALSLFNSGRPDDGMRILGARPAATQKLSAASDALSLRHADMQEWQTSFQREKGRPPNASETLEHWNAQPKETDQDTFSKGAPQELELTNPDGTKRKMLADRDTKTGGWVTADENRAPIHADAAGGYRIVPKNEPDVDISPEGMRYAAVVYRRTGKLPTGYGSASAEIRTRIINMAGKESEAEGGGAASDLATGADLHAEGVALSALAKTRANVTNFEDTANKEADLTLSLLHKGTAGGVPVLNRWIQAGRRNIEGDPDVASLNVALTSFKNEYARIMSSPGAAGGTTTDAARHEAETLINDAMTEEGIRAAIQTMKQGMKNRIDAINEAYDATRKRLRDLGPPATGSEARQPQAGGPKDGDKATSKSGKPMIFSGGTWQYQQ